MDYINHLYGRNKKKIIENPQVRICEFCDLEYGKYVITEYEIFKGVKVFYNDIHTLKITNNLSDTSFDKKRYEINHCREGRFECVLKDGTITYMDSDVFFNKLAATANLFFIIVSLTVSP